MLNLSEVCVDQQRSVDLLSLLFLFQVNTYIAHILIIRPHVINVRSPLTDDGCPDKEIAVPAKKRQRTGISTRNGGGGERKWKDPDDIQDEINSEYTCRLIWAVTYWLNKNRPLLSVCSVAWRYRHYRFLAL